MNQGKKLKVKKAAATTITLVMILSIISFMGIVGGTVEGVVKLDKTWYSASGLMEITVEDDDMDKPVEVEEDFDLNYSSKPFTAGYHYVNVSYVPLVWPDKPVLVKDANTGLQYPAQAVDTQKGYIGFIAPVDFIKGVNVSYTYDGQNEVQVTVKKAGQELGTVTCNEKLSDEGAYDTGIFEGTFTLPGTGSVSDGDTIYVLYEDDDPSATIWKTAKIDAVEPEIDAQWPVGFVNTLRPTISFKLEDEGAEKDPPEGSGLNWKKEEENFVVGFNLKGASVDTVTDDVRIDDGVVTYTPDSDLEKNKEYTVTVKINDNAGNKLETTGTVSWNFKVVLMPSAVHHIDVKLSDTELFATDDVDDQGTIKVTLMDYIGFPIPETGIRVDMKIDPVGKLIEPWHVGNNRYEPWTDGGICTYTVGSKDKKTGLATITITVGSFTEIVQVNFLSPPMQLELDKGWNLISLVRAPANPLLAGVFGTSGDIEKVYSYDAGWKTAFWNGATWTGTLTSIEDGKGYWVYSKEAYLYDEDPTKDNRFEIPLKTIDPLELPPSYELVAGWNLIGYTNLVDPSGNTTAVSYFTSLQKEGTAIWVSAYFYDEGYSLVKPTETEAEIAAGDGCWIYLTEPGTLVP